MNDPLKLGPRLPVCHNCDVWPRPIYGPCPPLCPQTRPLIQYPLRIIFKKEELCRPNSPSTPYP